MDFDGVTSLVSQNLIYYRSDNSTSGTGIPYGLYNSLCTLHLFCSSGCECIADKYFTNPRLRHKRNTRYRGLAKPYLTGTYTLQDASSFAWRTNAENIKALREKEHVSQAVFAAYLNTSPSKVRQWEQGNKKPRGTSLKLLNLVAHKGLRVLVY